MSHMTQEYQWCRVKVGGKSPIWEHPQGFGFGSRTISSTHPAIEISTTWKFIINHYHPRTLSELHPYSPWARPRPSRRTSLMMSLGPGVLVSRGCLALLPPSVRSRFATSLTARMVGNTLSPMLLTAGTTIPSRRKPFNRSRSISPLSSPPLEAA